MKVPGGKRKSPDLLQQGLQSGEYEESPQKGWRRKNISNTARRFIPFFQYLRAMGRE
jgi:hypothetical protein